MIEQSIIISIEITEVRKLQNNLTNHSNIIIVFKPIISNNSCIHIVIKKTITHMKTNKVTISHSKIPKTSHILYENFRSQPPAKRSNSPKKGSRRNAMKFGVTPQRSDRTEVVIRAAQSFFPPARKKPGRNDSSLEPSVTRVKPSSRPNWSCERSNRRTSKVRPTDPRRASNP